jgi:hypothetical protein
MDVHQPDDPRHMIASRFDAKVLSVSLVTNVFIFIVTSSEIRSIQAARNNPQSTMSRNLV